MQYSVTNRKVRIRHFELHVQQGILQPEAGTIVFLHDSLGCSTLWRNFPQQLAASLRLNYMI